MLLPLVGDCGLTDMLTSRAVAVKPLKKDMERRRKGGLSTASRDDEMTRRNLIRTAPATHTWRHFGSHVLAPLTQQAWLPTQRSRVAPFSAPLCR